MQQSHTTTQHKSADNQQGASGINASRNLPAVSVLQKTAPEEELLQKKPNNTGMPDNLKSGVENLSGFSMDDVKVHYNSSKPTQLQAHAYAQGTDIHMAPGQEKHLPHEAWHVVQQKQGRVQPTMQMKEELAVNDDKGLENEADMMGGKTLQMKLEEKKSWAIDNSVLQKKGSETFTLKDNRNLLSTKGTLLEVVQQQDNLHDNIANSKSNSDVAQLITFNRFTGIKKLVNWSYNSEEKQILAAEKRLKSFLPDMQSSKDSIDGDRVKAIENRFLQIEASTIGKEDYAARLKELEDLYMEWDDISVKLTTDLIKFDDLTGGYGDNWVDKRYVGVNAATLVTLVKKTYENAPEPYKTEKNKEVIREAILGELRLVKFTENDAKDTAVAFSTKRSISVAKNLIKMLARISKDWHAISISLELTGELKYIHLTGSDFHNDGQSASIVESDTGKKALYKPRSLSPDANLEYSGESVITELNKDGAGLATAKFNGNRDEQGEYGYMEFVSKEKKLTNDEAKNYYLKMGRMVVSTKLLGVTDLHQENIMTSSSGNPVIIDAETSFLPHIMMSETWGATGIKDSLDSFTKESKLTPNYFYTDAELYEWKQQGNQGEPDYGFITSKRQASYRVGGTYRSEFISGINDVLSYVANNQHKLLDLISRYISKVSNVRIVPLDTTELNGPMMTYNREPSKHELIIDIVQGDIIKKLDENGYKALEGADAIIKKWLMFDYDKTDIPIFHYEPKDDKVYYHGTAIAKHTPGLANSLYANVLRISKSTVLTVTKDLGV